MQINLYFIIGLLSLIAASSCNDDLVVYSEKIDVNGGQMSWNDSLVFNPEIPNTDDRYNLYMTVNHTTDFNYQNVYFKLHTHYPDSIGASGLVSVQLQGEDARWSGDCSSSRCEQEVLLKDNIRFEKAGLYTIVAYQASRDSVLVGLGSVGFSLEKGL